MSPRTRILVELALLFLLFTPVVCAQKPPSPTPSPNPAPAPPPSSPSSNPGQPTNPASPSLQPTRPTGDRVMFLRGRVATSDGTKLPHDALVERVCNNDVRQQVYTSPDGSFSMQLGSRNNPTLDASADGDMRYGGLSGGMPSE